MHFYRLQCSGFSATAVFYIQYMELAFFVLFFSLILLWFFSPFLPVFVGFWLLSFFDCFHLSSPTSVYLAACLASCHVLVSHLLFGSFHQC